ncbi:calcium-binding protein [Sphingomonas sp. LB3N6]|uniref:beta strand repeat-containing protein n=1 Tax=Sphingomonas fucosidasi TaxID=3096164 RepID=UPI002FC5C0DA
MATVNGDGGDNFLTGTEDEDVINGLGGSDTIDSVDRPANIFGPSISPQRDVVDAGEGNDLVTGGRLDQLDGGAGTDFLLLNFNFNGPVAGSASAIQLMLNSAGTGTASDGTSITGFESVNFFLSDSWDNVVNTGNVQAQLTGGTGADVLTTGSADDGVFGGSGDDIISTGGGNDTIGGGAGNDLVTGGDGDDTVGVDLANDGRDTVDLGLGNDTVRFNGATGNVRVTFTSSEVGNGNANDSNTMANQDGGLAVRIQAEDGGGNPTGPVSRYDDEGTTFIAGTQGITFDVRDLVSGVARGDAFEGVVLGTSGADALTFFPPSRAGQSFYYNAGMGDDLVTAGQANDFLVGGGGNDRLEGNAGNDSFIGGGGNDTLYGGSGNDIATVNVVTDGADSVDLGSDSDVVNVNSTTPGQVRLSFTSAQAGNGIANDSNTMANQDGGLAVRLQAENGSDVLVGPVSRYDDEGITFVGGAGVTFDVRDLVSGVQRGDQFEVATLGTADADTLTAVQQTRAYYINAGMGNDTISGGTADDFLVGGAGNDRLEGGAGDDQFIGGAGVDRFAYALAANTGDDTILDFMKTDIFVSDGRLRDGNGDGIIQFDGNKLLDLGVGDTVAFTGIDPMSGLRFLGQLSDGSFAYADATTRPMGAKEGTLANDTLNGSGGAQQFFFDTALGLDFGNDRIANFGMDDLIITTSAITDGNSDGIIAFGRNRTVDLADGTNILINDGNVRSLEFDGSTIRNGVEYFVYSLAGSNGAGVAAAIG